MLDEGRGTQGATKLKVALNRSALRDSIGLAQTDEALLRVCRLFAVSLRIALPGDDRRSGHGTSFNRMVVTTNEKPAPGQEAHPRGGV
jgi:hypothetical protein